jgi:hypothetical protein
MILVLSILAKAFVQYIFTSTYLLSETGELDKALAIRAEQNSTHEYFLRSVLLGFFPNDEAQVIRPRVTRMVDEVTSLIQNVISPDELERFKSSLTDRAEKSAQIWGKFQRSEIHFKATCVIDREADWEWNISKSPLKSKEVFDDLIPCGLENAVLTVFPQLLSVDDADDKLISPGIFVAKSQLGEAEEEEKRERISLAAVVESQPSRPRRRTREVPQAVTTGTVPTSFLGGQ